MLSLPLKTTAPYHKARSDYTDRIPFQSAALHECFRLMYPDLFSDCPCFRLPRTSDADHLPKVSEANCLKSH